jgi:hypothetical protein
LHLEHRGTEEQMRRDGVGEGWPEDSAHQRIAVAAQRAGGGEKLNPDEL